MAERFIFRSTYWENLEAYMRDGNIRSKEHQHPQLGYQISYQDIVNRRGESYFAPCGNSINCFVPFYYSPVQAMSYAIYRGNVELLNRQSETVRYANMDDLAFMVAKAERAIERYPDSHYVTSRACNSALTPEFGRGLDALEGLVSWGVFDEPPFIADIPEIGYGGVCKYFKDLDEPEYRRNRKSKRMAEFLVQNEFDFNLIECIVVFNSDVKSAIETWEVFRRYSIPVLLKPKYY